MQTGENGRHAGYNKTNITQQQHQQQQQPVASVLKTRSSEAIAQELLAVSYGTDREYHGKRGRSAERQSTS